MYLGAILVRPCPSGHDGRNALGKSGQHCPQLNPRPDDMKTYLYFNVLITAALPVPNNAQHTDQMKTHPSHLYPDIWQIKNYNYKLQIHTYESNLGKEIFTNTYLWKKSWQRTLDKNALRDGGGLTQTHFLMSTYQVIFGMPKWFWGAKTCFTKRGEVISDQF